MWPGWKTIPPLTKHFRLIILIIGEGYRLPRSAGSRRFLIIPPSPKNASGNHLIEEYLQAILGPAFGQAPASASNRQARGSRFSRQSPSECGSKLPHSEGACGAK